MSRSKNSGKPRVRENADTKQAARESRRAAERQKLAELRRGADADAAVMPETSEVSNPRDWD